MAGALLMIWAGMRQWAARSGAVETGAALRPRIAGAVLIALVLLLGWLARGLIVRAGAAAGVAAVVVLAAGAGLVALVRAAAQATAAARATATGRAAPPETPARRVAALVGALLAIAGPNVWLVIGGALLAAGSVSLVILAVAAAGLVPSLWFMHTVAGAVGLRIATIEIIPLSAAAEAMLAPALAFGAFALFGLWPLRRWGTPVLVPVGVAVLLRLGAAVPTGLQSWETVLVPLGVIALIHALLTVDPAEAVAAGAWLAAVTDARLGAILLAAGAVLQAVAARIPGVRTTLTMWLGVLTWSVTAAGAALTLQSLLGREVVYAVLSAAVTAALIARLEPVAA
jgi:hypothetical protein